MEQNNNKHIIKKIIKFPQTTKTQKDIIINFEQKWGVNFDELTNKYNLEFIEIFWSWKHYDTIRISFLDRKNNIFYIFRPNKWNETINLNIKQNKELKYIFIKTMKAPSNPWDALFIEHKLFF